MATKLVKLTNPDSITLNSIERGHLRGRIKKDACYWAKECGSSGFFLLPNDEAYVNGNEVTEVTQAYLEGSIESKMVSKGIPSTTSYPKLVQHVPTGAVVARISPSMAIQVYPKVGKWGVKQEDNYVPFNGEVTLKSRGSDA